jgi:hypothetical protein
MGFLFGASIRGSLLAFAIVIAVDPLFGLALFSTLQPHFAGTGSVT